MAKDSELDNEEPLSPTEAGAGDKSEKIKKLKKIALIVIPILVVVIAGVFFFLNVINGPKKTGPEAIAQTKQKEAVELDQNTYLDLDTMTIGLTPSGSKRDFLRISITLRLGSEAESNAVLGKMPIIKDTLVTFLKSLRATDFNSSNSTIFLKEEISKRLNKITAPVIIKEVLFQEITVQ
jgi:flagellar basal body-associated protein FliL